ncbi:MAG: class II poly(R)-hydroxyalkanoic acid synthase, partial [Pseudolabrys sp.]
MASESHGTLDHEIRDQALQHTLAANPLIGVRGHDFLDSARVLVGEMMKNPGVTAQQYFSFLGELGRIMTGGSELAPDAKDKRFVDPAWKESAAYRVLAQCYLAWSGALNRFVDEAKMDKRDAERVRFLVSLVLDAISPTNSLAGNPTALKKLIDTGGASLVHGVENLITDLVHNGGLPAQVDTRKFKVGKNLATTPGSVVYRSPVMELIQYRP